MTPLRQRMLDDMRLRNFSLHTQDSYLLQITQFARYFAKSPEVLGPDEMGIFAQAAKSDHSSVADLK